jgi:lysozyme family protein
MTAPNWQRACAVTLDFEGGNDDDPRDPGGRTSRGILQREWNQYLAAHPGQGLPSDVWRAPQHSIIDIYHNQYWQPMAGDYWPTGMDLVVYDAGVNSGTGKALRWSRSTLAQQTGTFPALAALATHSSQQVALIKRFSTSRLSFLEALGTWRTFGKGWAHRVAGIEAIATRWALASQGQPVAPVLESRAQEHRTAGAAAGTGASAAPAVPAGHVAVTTHAGWVDWTIEGVMILATVAIVAYLAHAAYVNLARANAMTAEAKK